MAETHPGEPIDDQLTHSDSIKTQLQSLLDHSAEIMSGAVALNEDTKIEFDGENSSPEKFSGIVTPHKLLPRPKAPPGILSKSLSAPPAVSSFRKTLRDRSNELARRISSFRESISLAVEDEKSNKMLVSALQSPQVTEFQLEGLKVVVKVKVKKEVEFDGRISFFSRASCRDCTAVRSFLRDRGLPFVEINVDVFPERTAELEARTGGVSVPAIFFNEKLIGGLVALNALRNSGEFDRRLRELAGQRCTDAAPRPPVYGFDDEEMEKGRVEDGMVRVVRVIRQRLPMQDRLVRMKIVRNCFAGEELIAAVAGHLGCGRDKALEIGKALAKKHFIHHIFREHDFEEGNHFYRFLEHEPSIPKCLNFRGATNDDEPKPATAVGLRLTKIMSAILEAYASADRRSLDYNLIGQSEEFRRYANLTQELQRLDVLQMSPDEKLAFFINLHNAMTIHAVVKMGGAPEGLIERRAFYEDFHYVIGGYPYSLTAIKNGILRANRRQPYSLTKPFSSSDQRLKVAVDKVNPLIHFGLCNGTRSSPNVRFFSSDGIEAQLRGAAREFFQEAGIQINLHKRIIHLTRIIKWYSVDFVEEKEILKWVLSYMDSTKAGLLTHLLSDGGAVHIAYMDYDWSLNS